MPKAKKLIAPTESCQAYVRNLRFLVDRDQKDAADYRLRAKRALRSRDYSEALTCTAMAAAKTESWLAASEILSNWTLPEATHYVEPSRRGGLPETKKGARALCGDSSMRSISSAAGFVTCTACLRTLLRSIDLMTGERA